MRMPSRRGFTLVELLVVIAIIAILATLAAPSFQDLLKANRVTSQSNEIVSLITLTRSEAIRRSANAEIVFTAPDQAQWNAIVAIPEKADGTPSEELRSTTHSGVELITSSETEKLILRFNSRGYLVNTDDVWRAETLELKHPNCTNSRQSRLITVQRTGQVDSNQGACP